MSTSVDGKRILVTGGAGFIGCAISHLLADRAEAYVVMDNLHPQIHKNRSRPSELHADAELFVGDVTDTSAWNTVLSSFRPQIVIHLAAETGTGQSLTEATRHGLVNVVGTTQMTDALSRHTADIEHLLLSSSRAIYGEGAWSTVDGTVRYPGQRTRWQLERAEWDFSDLRALPSSVAKTQPRPTSIYGATKLAQENILSAWALASKVRLSVLRLQNVYGPGQSLTNSYTGIVALFSQLAKGGQVIPLYEDGMVTRDFVHIVDVARAIAAVLDQPPEVSQAFDIGCGQATTIGEMARMLAAFYGAPAPVVCGKFRDGDVRHASCDLSPTTEALSWGPMVGLEDGLSDLQRWIASETDART